MGLPRVLVLMRGPVPDGAERKAVANLEEDHRVSFVRIRRGMSHSEERADIAFSKHEELLTGFKDARLIGKAKVKESANPLSPPEGYHIERKGAYYRLFTSRGNQVREKALRKVDMIALIDEINAKAAKTD